MVLAFVLACTGSGPEPSSVAPPVPDPVTPTAAGTPGALKAPEGPPFTASQIRDAMPAGQVVRWRYEMGDSTTTAEWRVRAADAVSMTLESIPPGTVETATWETLRDHAAFPAGSTTMEGGVSLTTGLGELVTRKYVVTDRDEVKTFWFSDAHPGPPVQHEVMLGGRRTFHMEQIARERVDPASWEPLPSAGPAE